MGSADLGSSAQKPMDLDVRSVVFGKDPFADSADAGPKELVKSPYQDLRGNFVEVEI